MDNYTQSMQQILVCFEFNFFKHKFVGWEIGNKVKLKILLYVYQIYINNFRFTLIPSIPMDNKSHIRLQSIYFIKRTGCYFFGYIIILLLLLFCYSLFI